MTKPISDEELAKLSPGSGGFDTYLGSGWELSRSLLARLYLSDPVCSALSRAEACTKAEDPRGAELAMTEVWIKLAEWRKWRG